MMGRCWHTDRRGRCAEVAAYAVAPGSDGRARVYVCGAHLMAAISDPVGQRVTRVREAN